MHEIIHLLWDADDVDVDMEEAYVEFRAQMVLRKGYLNRGRRWLDDRLRVGYSNQTDGIALLATILYKKGVRLDVIDKAMFCGDESARKKIRETLDKCFGEGIYADVFGMSNFSPVGYLEGMMNLYSKTVPGFADRQMMPYRIRQKIRRELGRRAGELSDILFGPRVNPAYRIRKLLERYDGIQED